MAEQETLGISVIVPCYNAGEYVEACVQSILDQDFSDAPYEVVIVDDASTDPETLAVLDTLNNMSEQITLLRHESNQGQSAARNTAIEHAQYKYIMPIDADDALTTAWKNTPDQAGYMQDAFRSMENSNDLVIAYCAGQFTGAKEGSWDLPPYSERDILIENMIPAYGMYRKDEAEDIGGYNEELRGLEDWDFWISLINNRVSNDRPAEVHKIDTPHYLYRQHEDDCNVSALHDVSAAQFYRNTISTNPGLYAKHLSVVPKMLALSIYDTIPDSVKGTGLVSNFVKVAKGLGRSSPQPQQLQGNTQDAEDNDISFD